MPAQPVTHRADAEVGELLVILCRQAIMPRRGQEIETTAVAPSLRRAFEAAKKVALEQ
jgi:hypothetical protein